MESATPVPTVDVLMMSQFGLQASVTLVDGQCSRHDLRCLPLKLLIDPDPGQLNFAGLNGH